jgi:hypothetical protein
MASHEPTALVLGRVLYLLIAFTAAVIGLLMQIVIDLGGALVGRFSKHKFVSMAR